MPNETLITNLPSRVVGGFKPAKSTDKGWIAVDYAVKEFRGVGLATGHDSGARELTIKLDLKGPHVLYLALGCGDGVRVWLDGEDGFREFITAHGGHQMQEARLHAADLAGKRLHIAPIPATRYREFDAHTFVGYIRAVKSDHAPKRGSRNLIATNDGYSLIALDGATSVRDVTKQFTPYRDSDYFRILWGPLGADLTGGHRTRVGTTAPTTFKGSYRRCDREFAASLKRMLSGGGDVLKTAVKSARDVGMEIEFYIRPEAFYCPFPYDEVFASKFYVKNPRWRCRDEFGHEIARMSYAFPQVQDHMLAYIDELLRYKPDGINLAFNRSLPMMICEQPVLDAFAKKHGRAPRLPEECDSPEMLVVRYEILQGFVERLRALLDKQKMSLSCIADLNNDHAKLMGLDVEALAARGLIESACVAGYCPSSPFWSKMRDKSKAKIYSSVHYAHEPGLAAPDPYNHQWQARAFKSVLDAGFAGAFWWDVETMFGNPYNWHVLRHGGSRQFLDRVIANDAATAVRFAKFTEVVGVRRDRYDPWRSY